MSAAFKEAQQDEGGGPSPDDDHPDDEEPAEYDLCKKLPVEEAN